jgi:hypothetical protein
MRLLSSGLWLLLPMRAGRTTYAGAMQIIGRAAALLEEMHGRHWGLKHTLVLVPARPEGMQSAQRCHYLR